MERLTGSIVIEGKLQQPEPGVYLQRNRLFAVLDALTCPLVVIQADAGYGKTTLLASYLCDRSRRALWYNLTSADRLPGVTINHLRFGLSRQHNKSDLLNESSVNLTDPQVAGVVLGSMIEHSGDSLALVFDDYDQVDEQSEVHALLLSLIEHLPPSAQLFILSRGRPPLPLARLGVDGRAALITRTEMAFTVEETAALFACTYGCCLKLEELDVVFRRLEGWVAGLHMTHEALLRLKEHELPAFWAQFVDSPALFDYLAEEVLSSLGEADLALLCRSAIFSQLHPAVLDEVFFGSNSAGFLEQMARRNLFTTRDSPESSCYRYHSLLRHYLYQRLAATTSMEEIRRLHLSAAEAYVRRDEIDFAIGHFLAANDYTRVSQLVNRLAQHNRVDVLLRLMEGSLEAAFPEMEEACGIELCRLLPDSIVRLVMPQLQALVNDSQQVPDPLHKAHAQQRLGVFYHQQGRLDESEPLLEASRRTFLAAGRLVPALVSSTLLSIAYLYAGFPEKGEGPLEEAINLNTGGAGGSIRQLQFARAEYALASHRFDEAEETALMALSGQPATVYGNAFAAGTLTLALLHQGRPDEALQAARLAVTYAEESQHRSDLGFAFLRLASVLCQTGRLAEAQEAITTSLNLGEDLGFRRAHALLMQAEIAHDAGSPQSAELWADTRRFWEDRGYRMNPAYAGLIAPHLLEQAENPFVAMRQSGVPAREVRPGQIFTESDSRALVLRALGPLIFHIEGREVSPRLWGRDPSRRLFFYLLVNRGHWVHRDQLLEALWPRGDPRACSNRLSVALHVLRRELRPFEDLVERMGDRYRFQLPDDTDSDLDTYVEFAEGGLEAQDEGMMKQASLLYRGDFLCEYPYDEFLENTRVHFHTLQTRLLTTIARILHERGSIGSALDYYRRAHRHFPLLEEPVRGIMELLLDNGEALQAAETYGKFRARLDEEAGAYPGEELGRLYQRALRACAYVPDPPPGSAREGTNRE